MAVPKQHDSKSKVGKRRSQKKLKKKNLIPCPNCSAPGLPHRACSFCGFYETRNAKKQRMKGKVQKEQPEAQEKIKKEETEKKEKKEEKNQTPDSIKQEEQKEKDKDNKTKA